MIIITSSEIIQRFREYAQNKGYVLKVAGRIAYRNQKRKILEYIRYNAGTYKITVYEEGAGKYQISLFQHNPIEESTFQKKLLNI